MKTLINNIELISFSYMNSNNNTINKSGIEYNYIAIAMNNMLRFTDNNIKNININKTNAIAIDNNLVCDISLVGSILAAILAIGGLFALIYFSGGTVLLILTWFLTVGGYTGFVVSLVGLILSC